MTSPLGFKINTLSWVFGFPVISSLLLTIIGQNIGILSSECKWGVCVNVSINSRFCVRRIAHFELSENKYFIELSFPGLFSFSCSPSDSRCFFLTSLPSGVIVVGSCLLLRSFSASQCNFSMKLYSSDAFLILQTCLTSFRFLIWFIMATRQSRNNEPKSAPHFQLCPTAKKFSNETRPSTEMKLTPQNLQFLFFLTFALDFRPLLQIFV